MVRNFVTGVVLGGVVAAGGLAVVSQIAPIRDQDKAAVTDEGAAKAAAEGEAAAPATPETVVEGAVVKEAGPAIADPAPLADAAGETDEPLLRPLGEPDAPPPALVVPDLTQPSEAGQSPVVDAAPVEKAAPVADEKGTEVAKAPSLPEPAPAEAEPTAPETAATDAPAVEAGTSLTPDDTPAQPSDPSPDIAAKPAQDPIGQTDAQTDVATDAPTLTPDGQLGDTPVEGVTTGRLPSISAEPDVAVTPEAAEPAPEVMADLPPLRRYARSFDNPQAKPLFAILLVDTGEADVARADLAALPFAVTFVLDPLAPGAAEAEAIYRAAGQEVVMLATAIPDGATASDLEQSFAGLDGKLTEAVALIDTAEGAFQNDRKLSAEVVTLLAAQGRGLVTFDRGLNAADQVARREGLAAATIFRSLDDDGEDAPLIRRYLDRAAFKAAQEGQVAVIGTTRAETIAALMEWTVEGRASSVALAPITALMDSK